MTQDQSPSQAALLDWLHKRFPDTPRSRAKEWILSGRVSVGGQVIRRPHHVLSDPGDSLVLQGRHAATVDCGSGWRIHPRVMLLHLDSALFVVNKGAALISVPATDTGLSALSIVADFLAGRLKPSLGGKSLPPSFRQLQVLPVHRLDQYTTGVFCMAANPDARRHLIEQVKSHTMRREYIAYVEGRPPADSGVWRNWLQLSEDKQRILHEKQGKSSEATEAVTHYDVVSVFERNGGVLTKLRLRLETGLKHQIRLQSAHAGLPLIGDRTYHPAYRIGSTIKPPVEFSRQALHAVSLQLEHPTGKRMSWAAELPTDLRDLEQCLRGRPS